MLEKSLQRQKKKYSFDQSAIDLIRLPLIWLYWISLATNKYIDQNWVDIEFEDSLNMKNIYMDVKLPFNFLSSASFVKFLHYTN